MAPVPVNPRKPTMPQPASIAENQPVRPAPTWSCPAPPWVVPLGVWVAVAGRGPPAPPMAVGSDLPQRLFRCPEPIPSRPLDISQGKALAPRRREPTVFCKDSWHQDSGLGASRRRPGPPQRSEVGAPSPSPNVPLRCPACGGCSATPVTADYPPAAPHVPRGPAPQPSHTPMVQPRGHAREDCAPAAGRFSPIIDHRRKAAGGDGPGGWMWAPAGKPSTGRRIRTCGGPRPEGRRALLARTWVFWCCLFFRFFAAGRRSLPKHSSIALFFAVAHPRSGCSPPLASHRPPATRSPRLHHPAPELFFKLWRVGSVAVSIVKVPPNCVHRRNVPRPAETV